MTAHHDELGVHGLFDKIVAGVVTDHAALDCHVRISLLPSRESFCERLSFLILCDIKVDLWPQNIPVVPSMYRHERNLSTGCLIESDSGGFLGSRRTVNAKQDWPALIGRSLLMNYRDRARRVMENCRAH
jgi:hypothetical protein